jgi:hypothetical protein
VDEGRRRKHQDRRQHDDRDRQPGGRREGDDVEHDDVPHRRKAAKPPIIGLHPGIGEIERAGQRDHEPAEQPPGLRHHIGPQQHRGGHEDIGDEIDDEIELRAVIARRQRLDLEPARQRPVEPSTSKRHGEPAESRARSPAITACSESSPSAAPSAVKACTP